MSEKIINGDKITKKSFIDDIKEEIYNDNIKEAKTKLKRLMKSEADAKKILRNIRNEIDDYLAELEEDNADLIGD